MSSEKFESLEDDLSSVLDSLRDRVEGKIPNFEGEEKKTAIRHAERNIEEANFILQEMEGEAKMAPISYRSQQISRIRNYRRDLDNITKNVKKSKGATGRGSDNFGFDRDEQMAASQRNKLYQGTQSLNRATDSIARTHQIAAETDEIGVEIIDELGRQRETLGRTRDRLVDTDSNLSKSRKILKTMATRVMTNKMILIVIILLEVCGLGGVIYWKFFTKHS
ncbi:vesicle transport through interaction with t-SNAREs homolog 1B-like [Mytilus californianus]|uniref:vesicle transport through interaction with t-SNAREs homolog 1B-like n=1 Tax=Mytilus californianus TaxID=6549 RepID=UPI00224666D0|nr:vesicle transport through interaction with t-SNAREs homolog 1B-like [Mytilus californianus]